MNQGMSLSAAVAVTELPRPTCSADIDVIRMTHRPGPPHRPQALAQSLIKSEIASKFRNPNVLIANLRLLTCSGT